MRRAVTANIALFLSLLTAAASVAAFSSLAWYTSPQGRHLPPHVAPAENYIRGEQYALDVLHYNIGINLYPEQRLLSGDVTLTAVIRGKGVPRISLNLYDNMAVESVWVNGAGAEFSHQGTALSIPFTGSAGDTVSVRVRYSGTPKKLGFASFVFGKINGQSLVYSLNEPEYASTWLPCNDRPADKALVDISITADSGVTSVSNGKLIGRHINAGRESWHWRSTYPIATYLICVYSSAYHSFTEQWVSGQDTLPLQYYVLPAHAEKARRDFEDHGKMLSVFSRLFGEYPFMREKYGVAEFLWQMGAMEHQTITGIGQNFVSGKKLFTDIYVHELAHHWWGNAVSPADWRDIWLNEGFATYSEVLFDEAIYGDSARVSAIMSKFSEGFSGTLYNPQGNLFSSTMYNKGAWVLHMLRREVGDSAFFPILRAYYQKFRYGNASVQDFTALCQQVSGKNLAPFFTQWLYRGEDMVRVSYSFKVTRSGSNYRLRLWLKQVQDDFSPYVFPLDIKVVYRYGNSEIKQVYVDSAEQLVELAVTGDVDDVQLDPGSWLLARFNREGK